MDRGSLKRTIVSESFDPATAHVDVDGFCVPVCQASIRGFRNLYSINAASGSFGTSFPASCAIPGFNMIRIGSSGATLWLPDHVRDKFVGNLQDSLQERGAVKEATSGAPGFLKRAFVVDNYQFALVRAIFF